MLASEHQLVTLWRNYACIGPPYALTPREQQLLSDSPGVYRTSLEYQSSEALNDDEDTRIHLGLVPVPYFGDLSNALVFVLMLNPGLDAASDRQETSDETYRAALRRNLRQENLSPDYPALFLDPQFNLHEGFRYWRTRLSDIAQRFTTEEEGFSFLAQRIAWLQLLPYHSRKFNERLRNKLPALESSKSMIGFVHDVVIPKALRDEATVIVVRGGLSWNEQTRQLPNHQNIITYKFPLNRGASLSLNSPGGKAIATRLEL